MKVGLVVQESTAVEKFHPTSFDRKLLTRRHLTRVKIENILQGKGLVRGTTVDIFYFVDGRNLGTSGTPMYFSLGDRDMLLLQRDNGELRTIADNFSNACVIPVLSGPHPNFAADLSKPAIQNITDLLVTRGEGVDNSQMAAAVNYAARHFYWEPFTTPKIQQIAKQDARLREQACRSLKQLDKPCKNNP